MQASGYTAAAALGQARAPVQVSVILPVHDAEPWLDECLGSVLQQDFEGSMELSIFNDASKDKSMTIIEKWKEKLEGSGILVVIGGHDSPSPRGVGYSKNQAIAQSSGSYLCFLDSKIFLAVDYYFLHLQVVRPAPHPSWALVIPGSPQTRSLRTTLHSEAAELKDDDVMMPQRVRLQHAAAVRHPTSIIGCQVRREPPNSTERYTRWINHLAPDQLLTQVFTSNGPTVIMPTWFCSRAWFSHVGPFDEGGRVSACPVDSSSGLGGAGLGRRPPVRAFAALPASRAGRAEPPRVQPGHRLARVVREAGDFCVKAVGAGRLLLAHTCPALVASSCFKSCLWETAGGGQCHSATPGRQRGKSSPVLPWPVALGCSGPSWPGSFVCTLAYLRGLTCRAGPTLVSGLRPRNGDATLTCAPPTPTVLRVSTLTPIRRVSPRTCCSSTNT
ncbi:UDP-GlcNAc:betaGal beta-1,3-N-acetylglucosaminyltransferase-like protein 1 isoform X2 [Delphinapterus leucas]|uniref:UDP-GlcNAc:betaGal beta-1,3-N-acetylglucosaminyltransferase-like protein 1 isoform X2 n=1 Tax=Delphinapterus leucas TaxID=9749 RepID=A0A7F8KCM4_DELLE|nr:UDP-GlcNAc:betaGal beta-1,3-N-acetylglucosaminyltransferase-like protein 1 isoform X2 [Delphinapterus leucas]